MQIEELLEKDLYGQLASPNDIGRAKRIDGVHDRYVEFAKRTLPRDVTLHGLRVAIDCAMVRPKVARRHSGNWGRGRDDRQRAERHQHQSRMRLDPSETLQKKVHETRADIGIALDGDADRVIIVDENGTVVDGDQLMAVIAETWAQDQTLRGGGIVATVMSNLGLERFLGDKGLTLARTKVGDRYVVEHMRNHDFNVVASNPATSCCQIMARPATASWQPCRSWQPSSAQAVP